jgi:hypothetical protein
MSDQAAFSLIEAMESRTLFSHVHMGTVDTPVIAADTAAYFAASNKEQADIQTYNALVQKDGRKVLKAMTAALAGSSQEAQLIADTKAGQAAYTADHAAATALAKTDLAVVTADEAKVQADQGNAGALSADQAKLAADQATMNSDVSAAEAKQLADLNANVAIEVADDGTVAAFLQTNAAYVAAQVKQEADGAVNAVTIQTDSIINQVAGNQLRIDSGLTSDLIPITPPPYNNNLDGFSTAQFAGGPANLANGFLLNGFLFQPSTTPITGGPVSSNPTVAADQAALLAAQQQYQTDQNASVTQLLADKSTLDAARATALTGSSLGTQLISDETAATTQATADSAAEYAAAQADLPAVIADYLALAADHGNFTKLSADESKLGIDQAKLQADTSSAVAMAISDSAASTTTITNDNAAIATFVAGNSAFAAAQATLNSDETADQAKIQADSIIITTAQNQLTADQKAAAAVVRKHK